MYLSVMARLRTTSSPCTAVLSQHFDSLGGGQAGCRRGGKSTPIPDGDTGDKAGVTVGRADDADGKAGVTTPCGTPFTSSASVIILGGICSITGLGRHLAHWLLRSSGG